ncbi:MAG: molybdopterin-dependent oxidoreductase [Salinicola sp.]|uniref:molybdopterin-dependent oxidoreductase n=1 Tax=Salinicola sp. TaxID=1978524 RepID=UPI001DCAC02C|nr:molybdopterin-dependent oxidoreductase [Salinicola sp.]NRB55482.1 molybdopterin-dependent oxidoreductase [Salinicola sp.]
MLRPLILGVLIALSSLPVRAEEPPYPADMPLLKIVDSHGRALASFTLSSLEALPSREVTGSIPDTSDPEARWSGVSLNALLESLSIAAPDRMLAVGLDDYSDIIPRSDLEHYDPIVAYRRNGHYLAVDRYGPLVVMYPYTDYPELHERTYYSRTVWQLSELQLQ